MNKQALLELLKNPDQISEQDLKGLEKMVEAFPYFQAAHALLAKAAKQDGDMHADKKTRKAAAYSGERKILKKLLTDKPVKEDLKKDIIPAELSTDKKPAIVEKQENETEKEPQTILPVTNKIESEKKPEQTEINEVEKKEHFTPVQENMVKQTSGNDHFYNELQENLKRLRDMRAKLAAGLPIEEIEKVVEKKSQAKETIDVKTDVSNKPEFKSEEKTTDDSSQELIPERIKEHTDDEDIFTSRLDEVVSAKKDRHRAIDEGELLLNYLSFLETHKKTEPEQKEKKSKSTDELIERFIKEEPSIPKLNKINVPEEQEDKASASYQLKTNLASENMAKIMLLQGRKDKAVEIYEQLMLKYPEKKAYFATQIEQIKAK